MAELVDERQEDQEETVELFEDTPKEATEEAPAPVEAEQVVEEAQEEVVEETTEDDVPDKYKGKSVRDIVRMHQEAEKYIGRQSQEVGDLRKQVDLVLQAQLAQQAPKTEPEPEPDFLLEPEKAIDKAIASHPKIKEAEQVAAQYKQATALTTLNSRHPDMKEILNDHKFADWVGKSKYRVNMFQEADQNYDYEAADELFTLWKERNEMASKTINAEKASRKKQVKQADTGSAQGSDVPRSKKTYRRADLIRLMKEDPSRYASMSEEIYQAYAEGRVK